MTILDSFVNFNLCEMDREDLSENDNGQNFFLLGILWAPGEKIRGGGGREGLSDTEAWASASDGLGLSTNYIRHKWRQLPACPPARPIPI